MTYPLLSCVTLPFKAGCENIITALSQPKELSVIKRIFEDNQYKYELQSDKSLHSLQGRVAMFFKGAILCVPLIGHITSLALRYFSSSIFLEMPLDFAVKCSLKQKMQVAKCIYTDKPEGVNEATRMALAGILVDDEEGLNLVIDNIGYINLASDTAFTQKLIQQKLAALDQTENSDFSKQILNFLEKCPPEQKLTITKFIYTNKVEAVNEATRIALAGILVDDEEGFNLLIDNTGYINLADDVVFSQIKVHLAKQILKKDPTDVKFILDFLNSLNLGEDSQQKVIKELILQTKGSKISHQMQAAINHAILQSPASDIFIQQLLRNPDTNITAANTLLSHKEGSAFVIANISYINLFQDIVFTRKLFQINPIPGQIKQHFTKQILERDATDANLIINIFDDLQLNQASQKEVIKELLSQMTTTKPSDQMQAAIAHTIIEKYPRGPVFLVSNIDLFKHTQELADILMKTVPGKTYINNTINKFEISEEQKNSLLQKCITHVLV